MATAETKSVGIYCRISLDAEDTGAGVDRQEKDCRAYCATRGYEVAKVYVDNSVSAYSGKKRPAYEEMMSDLRDGKIAGVVVYHLDRLTRRPIELEEFIGTAESVGAVLGTVTGDIDLSTHDGQLQARIMGAVARKASDDASRRLKRKWLADAEAGKVKKGGARPYGFNEDRETIKADEAAIIRESALAILEGASVYSVAKSLNERGVPTVTGKKWTPSNLKRMLLAHRNAALLTYKGTVMGPAPWPAIISAEEFSSLQAILEARQDARPFHHQGAKPSYVLSGIATCANCGKPLSVGARSSNRSDGSTVPIYTCKGAFGANGCGGVSIKAELADEVVKERVLDAVMRHDFTNAAALNNADAKERQWLVEQIATLDARIAKLDEDFYVSGALPEARYRQLRAKLTDELGQLRTRFAEAATERSLEGIPLEPAALSVAWDAGGIEFRRRIVQTFLASVSIGKSAVRYGFDPNRITTVAVITPKKRKNKK